MNIPDGFIIGAPFGLAAGLFVATTDPDELCQTDFLKKAFDGNLTKCSELFSFKMLHVLYWTSVGGLVGTIVEEIDTFVRLKLLN
jgi:hypothetical protein